MLMSIIAVVGGLALLVWSADKFVEGAAATARYAGMSPLLIGMIIVGFGTSAPEMIVSAISSAQGNPGLALGNAYGSNIANIALILGLTAIISPIAVHSQVLRKELPVLTVITAIAVLQIADGRLSRIDAITLFVIFSGLVAWSIRQSLRRRGDMLDLEMKQELEAKAITLKKAIFLTVFGLLLLLISSRALVWGAVKIAVGLGISDLIIGLTVVAIGTSLPELASSIMAARKGEHDIALGNIIGSNLFNTLAVVGIAGIIHPMDVATEVLTRDCLVMGILTVSLFLVGYGFGGPGRINRYEGVALIVGYIAYTAWLTASIFRL